MNAIERYPAPSKTDAAALNLISVKSPIKSTLSGTTKNAAHSNAAVLASRMKAMMNATSSRAHRYVASCCM
jgi:hypothetical protein